jgi:hypothetical protein
MIDLMGKSKLLKTNGAAVEHNQNKTKQKQDWKGGHPSLD